MKSLYMVCGSSSILYTRLQCGRELTKMQNSFITLELITEQTLNALQMFMIMKEM